MVTLLQQIEAFLDEHEMAASTFGASALGDRHFVRQLRAGRRVWDETAFKVRSFMETYAADAAAQSPGNAKAVSPAAPVAL